MPVKLDKTNLTRDLANNSKLVHLIDRVIASKEIEIQIPKITTKVKDDAFHPSSDCIPSAIQLFEQKSGLAEKAPFPPSTKKSFFIGHAVHAYLQYIVVNELGYAAPEAIEAKKERRWANHPYHWVRGYGDIAPCHLPGESDPWLIDIKTCNTLDFRQNGIPRHWKDKYTCQIQIYMDLFDIENALFIFFQKDSPHDMREVHLRRDQNLIDAIYLKWQIAGQAILSNIPPKEDVILPLGE
jgi:hypothetical protein